MAKIVYGVAGQGFGHATRSQEILKYLVSQGHQVLVLTYGQALFFLAAEFEVFEIPGLGLSYQDNKLVYWRTIYKNASQLAKQSKNWRKILRRFRDFNPDFVITDFEPLSALLAKVQRVPLISLDNQHQLTNTKIELPWQYRRDLLADQLAIKSMVWGANYYLITSFFETKITKPKTFLFPPILRQEILKLKPQRQDFILVYQTSDFDGIVKELKKIKENFVVVGFDREEQVGRLQFKKYSHDEWLNDLANCKAVVGNAGLSLIGECLYLGKPYLAIPVAKQVEQIINAVYLQRKFYGRFIPYFSQAEFADFMKDHSKFEANLKKYRRQDNGAIKKKLDEIIGQ
jgi:uncharacterized protein (TIGR00661 family)